METIPSPVIACRLSSGINCERFGGTWGNGCGAAAAVPHDEERGEEEEEKKKKKKEKTTSNYYKLPLLCYRDVGIPSAISRPNLLIHHLCKDFQL